MEQINTSTNSREAHENLLENQILSLLKSESQGLDFNHIINQIKGREKEKEAAINSLLNNGRIFFLKNNEKTMVFYFQQED